MLTCPFVHLILQSKGQKVPKSGSFKNEGIPEHHDRFPPTAMGL